VPAVPVPPDVDEFLARPNPAVMGTITPSGDPRTVATWYVWDDGRVLLNLDAGRARLEDLRRDPRVSVSVFDPESVYDYFEVEGTAELVLDGADEHISELSRKYTGKDFHTPKDRVIVKVTPRRIFDYTSPR